MDMDQTNYFPKLWNVRVIGIEGDKQLTERLQWYTTDQSLKEKKFWPTIAHKSLYVWKKSQKYFLNNITKTLLTLITYIVFWMYGYLIQLTDRMFE